MHHIVGHTSLLAVAFLGLALSVIYILIIKNNLHENIQFVWTINTSSNHDIVSDNRHGTLHRKDLKLSYGHGHFKMKHSQAFPCMALSQELLRIYLCCMRNLKSASQ